MGGSFPKLSWGNFHCGNLQHPTTHRKIHGPRPRRPRSSPFLWKNLGGFFSMSQKFGPLNSAKTLPPPKKKAGPKNLTQLMDLEICFAVSGALDFWDGENLYG